MPSLTFHPIGNADCCLITVQNGKLLLFDYANMRSDSPDDRRIDLAGALRARLKEGGRSGFDVVAFTHLDDDHVHGASSFFALDHAAAYQGGGRVKIDQLWVPAAAITETKTNLGADATTIQAEARYRLKQGRGIRVFSQPDALAGWLAGQGLSLAARQGCITDAGTVVPGFSLAADGLEIFAHSPFAERHDGALVQRNLSSIVVQITFSVDGQSTKAILSGDADAAVLTDMVNVTKYHHNDHRLVWDIFKLPHHCSYTALAPDKAKDVMEPVPEVAWLFEQGAPGCIVVSPSDPIPQEDTVQPPHIQAARYYRRLVAAKGGEFIATMEHPTRSRPEPLTITIDARGATVQKRATGPQATSRPAPRAG